LAISFQLVNERGQYAFDFGGAPIAMEQTLAKSPCPVLPHPSAKFAGMDERSNPGHKRSN
jgi:hypothetical protein